MAQQRAKIRQLLDHLYLIDDAGDSTCYLLCGRDRAMVIDTVNGYEDLHAIVRSLAQLPLIVVNTHGHCDHIYGNIYFEEAFLHPEDVSLAQEHFGFAQEMFEKQNRTPCPFRTLEIGQVFDLGGVELEVVSLRGHTPGSVGLLDRQDRLLFSGDGVNTHLWMQLDNSTSIARLRDTLTALMEQHGHEFDRILGGHDKDFREFIILEQLLQGCDELLAGKREKDQPYHYFGGNCWQHPLSEEEGHCIVYTEEKLQIQ